MGFSLVKQRRRKLMTSSKGGEKDEEMVSTCLDDFQFHYLVPTFYD